MGFQAGDKVIIVRLDDADRAMFPSLKEGDVVQIQSVNASFIYVIYENKNLWLHKDQVEAIDNLAQQAMNNAASFGSPTFLAPGYTGGLNTSQMGYDAFYGYEWGLPEKKEEEKPKTKCECGASSVAGHEGDNPDQHSSWCPIYKEKK